MTPTLNRKIVLGVSQDGVITYWARGHAPKPGEALPFHSVNTPEEAEAIQVRYCKRAYDEHGHETGDYKLNFELWNGQVDEVLNLAAKLGLN